MFKWRTALAGAAALAVVGCEGSTIFKKFNIDEGFSVSIDAKQRVILVTDRGGRNGDQHVVCAEPSPDAIVAQSAAIAVEGGFKGVNVGVAGSLRETAGAIGLRTTTIQLLRDGLYRACEAYMNGAIGKEEYNLIIRNYDRVMTAVFAIDAAAGLAQAPSVVVNAGGATAKVDITRKAPGTPDGGGGTGTGAEGTTGAPEINVTKVEVPSGGLNQHSRAVIEKVITEVFEDESPLRRLCLRLLDSQGLKAEGSELLKAVYSTCRSILGLPATSEAS